MGYKEQLKFDNWVNKLYNVLTMKKQKTKSDFDLPLLSVKNIVVFPFMVTHFDVDRVRNVNAINQAMAADGQKVMICTQCSKEDAADTFSDLYRVGTVATVRQTINLPAGGMRVLIEGLGRAEILDIVEHKTYNSATIKKIPAKRVHKTDENLALLRIAKDLLGKYIEAKGEVPYETLTTMENIEDLGEVADVLSSGILSKIEDKQDILEIKNPIARITKTIEFLQREIELKTIEKELQEKTMQRIFETNRDHFLHEQIEIIKEQLGEVDEIDEYSEKLKEAKYLSDEAREVADKQISRLAKMHIMSPESEVVRTYIETLLDLNWTYSLKETLSINKVKSILNEDHFGIEEVKERILDFLAIKKKAGENTQILCLVGAPGIGKTSIAKSIARALGRNFERISLGGVNDVAAIKGHRRTYIGAMPGQIMTAIKKAKCNNPVILLDEIDKIGNDYKGDPYSCLLEALDPEQNKNFTDNYVEVPFDLSNVMFICTANSLDTIPKPLKDRMEIIHMHSYLPSEKMHIAHKYLVKKQMKKANIGDDQLEITANAIYEIINYYTREAGVRELERQIAKVCSKAARKLLVKDAKIIVDNALTDLIGKPKYTSDKFMQNDEIGIVNGLAWTEVGGVLLPIEASIMPGSGKLQVTGQIGKVMEESANAAFSWVRSKFGLLNIKEDFYKNNDVHIHVPEGAVPKDGPSAGIAMATCLMSAIAKIPVRADIAMTGETSLTGRVMPIGGLREKATAAYSLGIKTIIIPKDNVKDIDELPKEISKNIKFIPVAFMDEVVAKALNTIPYINANWNGIRMGGAVQ